MGHCNYYKKIVKYYAIYLRKQKKTLRAKQFLSVKPQLQFEIVLNMYAIQHSFEYELYLKVGEEHVYVVKEIIEVIGYLLKGDNYTFGKQLTYDPETHSILPDDLKLLNYIYEIGKTQEETIDMVVIGQYTPNTTGALVIPPKYIPELLKRLLKLMEDLFVWALLQNY